MVCKVAPKSIVEYVTDHQPLFKSFYSDKDVVKKNMNHDILKTIFSTIAEKEITVKVRWMPSHLKTDTVDLLSGVSVIDILGNDLADKWAKVAADRCCVDLNSSSRILFYGSLVRRIQARLATIITYLLNRLKQLKPPLHLPSHWKP